MDGSLGVAITGLYLEDDKPKVDPEVRAMLESLRFTTKKQKESAQF